MPRMVALASGTCAWLRLELAACHVGSEMKEAGRMAPRVFNGVMARPISRIESTRLYLENQANIATENREIISRNHAPLVVM